MLPPIPAAATLHPTVVATSNSPSESPKTVVLTALKKMKVPKGLTMSDKYEYVVAVLKKFRMQVLRGGGGRNSWDYDEHFKMCYKH